MLTEAQLKLPGPLQPAGSVLKLPDIPKPEMANPSLEVKAMLTVSLAPTATATVPPTEAVATTEFSEPVITLIPGGGGVAGTGSAAVAGRRRRDDAGNAASAVVGTRAASGQQHGRREATGMGHGGFVAFLQLEADDRPAARYACQGGYGINCVTQ